LAPAGIANRELVRGVTSTVRIVFSAAAALDQLIGMRVVPIVEERFRSNLDFGVELARTVSGARKALADLANTISGAIERRQLMQRPTGSRARVSCCLLDTSSNDK